MTDFTRLTIAGSLRRAELVIPTDEALGGLIPRLMDLLGEATGSVARHFTLVRFTGEQLDLGLSAGEQKLEDGELLRLVRQDDAPPPPEVADVTDVLAESRSDRTGLWSPAARDVVAAVAIGAFSLVGTTRLGATLAAPGVTVGVGIVAFAIVAAILGVLRLRLGVIAFTATAVGAALPGAALIVDGFGIRSGTAATAIAAIALILGWFSLGLGMGIGLRIRPALWASAIGVALPLVALILLLLGSSVVGAIAIAGVVAIILCGVLPWYAMSASGLTGLDDQVVEGRLRRRDSVLVTVNTAYRALSWSVFAVAVPLALSTAALLSSRNLWAVGLGAAIAVILALRTRAFPLAAQVITLWIADAVAVVAGLALQPLLTPATTAGILFGLALVVAIMAAARPANHQRASLRRVGNTIEALAVIALLPVLIGVFGIYTDLIGAF
jgi:type VII secretion integral membrane protein EccD